MKRVVLAIGLMALRPLLAAALQGSWTVTASHELGRPAEPGSLSGITRLSNDTYLAATDWNPTLYELTLPLDPVSARPLSCTIRARGRLTGRTDVEDVASDPLDRAFLLAVDESSGTITRHSVTGGPAVATFRPPRGRALMRTDMGLESLALSSDGLTCWIANEESYKADGPISCRTRGTDVRLMRFRRTGLGAAWRPDGEWAYRTDPIAGASWKKKGENDAARSGVSALCALEDGTLLALEREFSVVVLPRFRCRVYEVDLAAATDVRPYASVTNGPIVRAGKRLLHEATGLAMYEGLCEGPRLADGARSLVLVSDGDHRFMVRSVLTLKLERRSP